MKTYRGKYLCFLAPFIIAVVIELALPLDCFTFKVWEALIVRHSYGILNGPFYPVERITKHEQGDLAHHTPHTILKNVTWDTDRYGYRTTDRSTGRYDVVLIGDSMIAGSGLTQEDTLAEMLERETGLSVYPLAPGGGARSYGEHPLFLPSPPKIVILERVERNITHLSMPKSRYFSPNKTWRRIRYGIESNRILQVMAEGLDRIFKGNMLNFIRASIRRVGGPSLPYISIDGQPFFFLEGAKANRPYSEDQISRTVDVIQRYHDTFSGKGIRFIFLPIPNKETIYHKPLGTEEPHFLETLTARLRDLNIEVIDTQPAFKSIYEDRGRPLYHSDDTHWNRDGVALVTELVAETIRKPTSR